jgi:hypothetical protein
MANRDPARAESTDEVKWHLNEGLKSCTKLLASYREAFSRQRQVKNQWKA